MDIIVVSNKRGRTWRIKLHPRNVLSWLLPAVGVASILSLVFMLGFWVRGEGGVLPTSLVSTWAKEAQAQRQELALAREKAEQDTHALARRIALLHAHVMRLDAAGQRLTEVAGLDAGEFNFRQTPPVGGPEEPMDSLKGLENVLLSLDQFEQRLSDRERQMRVLEDLLLASRLQKQVKPSGWPVENGWISSSYGWRTDPFTGRYTMHSGVDFAARDGSHVLAVAAGIVTEVADRSGYGLMVEVNHGNGYVTRYAHNDGALVVAGQKIRKGERIATMGSSGRSTGPHVHLEVLFNGRAVNPEEYIQAAR